MLNTYEQHSRRKLIATILTIAVIAGVVVFADHIKSLDSSNTTSPKPATSTATNTTTSSGESNTSSTGNFKDGTYTASEDYIVPPGNESIQVTVTLSNGIITNSSIQNSEGDHDSAAYQEDFAAQYKKFVIGKKISGLRIEAISGASDTADAFNEALNRIATQAKV